MLKRLCRSASLSSSASSPASNVFELGFRVLSQYLKTDGIFCFIFLKVGSFHCYEFFLMGVCAERVISARERRGRLLMEMICFGL